MEQNAPSAEIELFTDKSLVSRLREEDKVSNSTLPKDCDDELALSFTAVYGQDLKYVALWNQWFQWDGTRWAEDDTLNCYDRARNICRARARLMDKERAAGDVASAKTVSAIERLARADRAHAAVTSQFDADPMLLNTPTGTMDLRTGELRPHSRTDWITKRAAVGPSNEGAPKWREFLKRVTGGDRHLEQYLQRIFGYSLTGLTTEHAFFFFYGSGANGKSTYINTMTQILGDYATVASTETFVETTGQQHPTDLAMLRGARLVTAQEIDEGRRWALSKMKHLTGGDPVTARFVRADFFTYVPQFKLCISANHRPGLRAVDEAIKRRLHVVPFTVFIPPSERDPRLVEALKAEWGAILAWAIEGCVEWQMHGLDQPQAVRDATAAYLTDEDVFAHWIDDACDQLPSYQEPIKALYASYRRWAEHAGERVLGSKRFSQALAERGFQRVKMGAGDSRGFGGLRLKLPIEDGSGDV